MCCTKCYMYLFCYASVAWMTNWLVKWNMQGSLIFWWSLHGYHKEAWPYHSSTRGTSLVTSQEKLNSRFSSWRTSVCMALHPLTWGKCWKSMSHRGHWDQHPRTYSASREPTWKPTVTDHLVPVPQNYGISSQIIFGQLGVWQSSNDNWKHICSKMYLSNNYVDINIYPLTMNVMRLWACLYGKGAISNDNIIIIIQPAMSERICNLNACDWSSRIQNFIYLITWRWFSQYIYMIYIWHTYMWYIYFTQ